MKLYYYYYIVILFLIAYYVNSDFNFDFKSIGRYSKVLIYYYLYYNRLVGPLYNDSNN